jgi:hypothetical protein
MVELSFNCMFCNHHVSTLVYSNIRGDENNEHTVNQCNLCGHTQLFPYQYDHEEHYEDDKQTEYVTNVIGTKFEKMIEYQELEHKRRIKILMDRVNIDKSNNNINLLDVGCGYGI